MSMSKIVQDAINRQVNAELSASYQYLAMSAYCEQQHLRGIALREPAPPQRVRRERRLDVEMSHLRERMNARVGPA